MSEKSALEEILERIKEMCEEYNMTFSQVVCETFFLFDDEFEGMHDEEVLHHIEDFETRAKEELNGKLQDS